LEVHGAAFQVRTPSSRDFPADPLLLVLNVEDARILVEALVISIAPAIVWNGQSVRRTVCWSGENHWKKQHGTCRSDVSRDEASWEISSRLGQPFGY
jgi:hypothetical protein